ncbi:MAG: hypothetical protein JW819_05000 [Candidatus Krumholzibacteriota bacterium]|nr:hypothetical protein [Candidatus Krumholzibacteriota bacterium]
MTDTRRTLRELLADPAAYETPAPPAGEAWRRRLLASRYGATRRRRGTALVRARRLPAALRPALIAGLSTLAALILGVTAYLSIGLPGAEELSQRLRPEAWNLDAAGGLSRWLAALDAAVSEQAGEAALPAALMNPYLWIGLVAASALLTLLVRGRLARLIPVSW